MLNSVISNRVNEEGDFIKRDQHLDGLRAIAVLMVVVFHCSGGMDTTFTVLDKILAAGWLGVDLFFVLSGFLITRILMKEKDKKNYYLKFWYNRALRIFPLYYLYLGLVLLFVSINNREFYSILHDVVFHAFYLQNIQILIEGRSAIPSLLIHTWSLAIEQHFYLFWPIFVKKLPSPKLALVCLLIIVVSPIIRYIAVSQFEIVAYFQTFGRLDAMAAGGLISIVIEYNKAEKILQKLIKPVLLISFLSIVLLVLVTDRPSHRSYEFQVYGFSFALIYFAAIVFYLQTRPSYIRHILSNSVLKLIAQYSYAIYIVHYPILHFVRKVMSSGNLFNNNVIDFLILFLVVFFLSYIVSILSWKIIERPLMKFKY